MKADPYYIIIAPHPDDEIIGCFSLLQQHPNDVTIIYGADEPGCDKVQEYFRLPLAPLILDENISMELILEKARKRTDQPIWIVAPDPYFEVHPDHRFWGMTAEGLYRDKMTQGCVFYSTIMRTPYIYEIHNPEQKREALDYCYLEKADLWRYDHRYWLFEGMCQWHFHGVNFSEE